MGWGTRTGSLGFHMNHSSNALLGAEVLRQTHAGSKADVILSNAPAGKVAPMGPQREVEAGKYSTGPKHRLWRMSVLCGKTVR